MRQPSPIDVTLKVGWLLVFGIGLQQPTFIGSQQKKTDNQQTNASPHLKSATSIGKFDPSAVGCPSVRRPAILRKVYVNIANTTESRQANCKTTELHAHDSVAVGPFKVRL